MEFLDVFNPLYAAPIVAVIVCAILVYAFGFKSPVQPPSFDGIEEDKKFVKKRKVKETQKGKQQNGKLNANVTKSMDISTVGSKRKGIVEKSSGKSELKVGKKSNSATVEKKKSSLNKEIVPVAEDGNDEGWVHLVSKKVRKNRKKDDVTLVDEISQPVVELNTAEVHTHDESKVCTNGQVNISTTEPIQQNSADIVKQDVTEEPVIDKCKAVTKQPQNHKKKHGKKDDTVVHSKKPQEYNNVDSEKSSKYEVILPNSLEVAASEFESPAFCETENASQDQKQPKKKKAKKKTGELLEQNKISNVISSESPPMQILPNIVSSKTVNNAELPAFSPPEVISDQSADHKVEPSTTKLSNVAFDELTGLYPEEKAQKKKKRVRREH